MATHDEPIDDRDDATLAHLRQLFAHADPVPAGLVERMELALTVQALHAEVAELIEAELLATRGTAPPSPGEATRTESVTFQAPSLRLMVSVAPGGDDDVVRLDGWVTRAGAQVDVVTAAGTRTVTSDEHGRFAFDDVPRGRTSFVVRVGDGAGTRPVITPAVEL
ncbi:MAG TPA: hypothetical protein VFJ94_01845 [Intrasporangium sp.]|uniref:hypothetical protein n=1 Tax=Intrasporangium sp. TaxID=1925024 RepID=UPI002D78A656|nr:hypothetical protein [Intrasporangium sp.]HET7397237.1 hypothetical protein [Intrasporangium sp.]